MTPSPRRTENVVQTLRHHSPQSETLDRVGRPLHRLRETLRTKYIALRRRNVVNDGGRRARFYIQSMLWSCEEQHKKCVESMPEWLPSAGYPIEQQPASPRYLCARAAAHCRLSRTSGWNVERATDGMEGGFALHASRGTLESCSSTVLSRFIDGGGSQSKAA